MPSLQIARTISDTVLGEAYHGAPQDTYADALGIYSTMVNRANQTGISVEDVALDQAQYNAYGKALPEGVEANRHIIDRAISYVDQNGPVTRATYYATPAAYGNLPGGLQSIDQTRGHIYAVDPQNRPINTRLGTMQIQPQRVEQTASMVSQSANAALGTGQVAAQAPAPTHQHQHLGNFSVDLTGAQRRDMPTNFDYERVGRIAEQTIPGISTKMYSGMEPPGTPPVNSPYRHPLGVAGDFSFSVAGQPLLNKNAYEAIAMNLAKEMNANIGIGPDYMHPGLGVAPAGLTERMHVDTSLNQYPGMGTAWGEWGKDFNADIHGTGLGNLDFARTMRGTTWSPGPVYNAPTPYSSNLADPNVGKMRSSSENMPTTRELAGAYQSMGAGLASVGRKGVGGAVAPASSAPLGQVGRVGPDRADRTASGPASSFYSPKSPTFSNMVKGMDSPVYGPGQRSTMSVAPSVRPGSTPAGIAPAVMSKAYSQWSKPMAQDTVSRMVAGQNMPVTPAGVPMSQPKPATTPADLAKAYTQAAYQRAPAPAPAQPNITDLAAAYKQAAYQRAPVAPIVAKEVPTLNEVAQVAPVAAPAQKRVTVPAPPAVRVMQPKQVIAPPPQPVAPPVQRIGLPNSLLPGQPKQGFLGQLGIPSLGNPMKGLGALFNGAFGGVPTPTKTNYGTGLKAMSSILGGGGTAGATAYSRSTPGYSVTNLGNGFVSKTNQYGHTSYSFTGYTSSLFGGKNTGKTSTFGNVRSSSSQSRSERASSISPGASRATGGGSHAPSRGGLY
jgi:hypothetical protein